MAGVRHASSGYWGVSCLVLIRDEQILKVVKTLIDECRMESATYVEDLDQAMLHMCSNAKTDMVICDAIEYAEDHLALTAFVRWSEYSRNKTIPVVIFSSTWTQPRFNAARDIGATSLMIMPMTFHSLFRRFMSIQVAERPFIDSEFYRGPDRRMKSNPAFPGPFRRGRDRPVLKDPNYVEPPKQRPIPPEPPKPKVDPSVANQASLFDTFNKK